VQQEQDSLSVPGFVEFSYRDCRGPQHHPPEFYIKELFQDILLFFPNSI